MWEDPWAKTTKPFVVFSIYKTSIYIPWWSRNTFLGGQTITFLVDNECILLLTRSTNTCLARKPKSSQIRTFRQYPTQTTYHYLTRYHPKKSKRSKDKAPQCNCHRAMQKEVPTISPLHHLTSVYPLLIRLSHVMIFPQVVVQTKKETLSGL